jgi:AbrB family looped-hinge helix DNA binding protein
MFATLTSKGQLTLPKAIRDWLNLDAGTILDFQIEADNTITARHVKPDARRVRGLLKSPHAAPPTVEQMGEAVAKLVRICRLPDRRQACQAGLRLHSHL